MHRRIGPQLHSIQILVSTGKSLDVLFIRAIRIETTTFPKEPNKLFCAAGSNPASISQFINTCFHRENFTFINQKSILNAKRS